MSLNPKEDISSVISIFINKFSVSEDSQSRLLCPVCSSMRTRPPTGGKPELRMLKGRVERGAEHSN